MGDMLRNFYGGGFAPYEYERDDECEGDIIEYEDDFPTADEMRERQKELSAVDRIILDAIKAALKETTSGVNQILYEGDLTSTVVEYLYKKGYKVDYIRSMDNPYTKISW